MRSNNWDSLPRIWAQKPAGLEGACLWRMEQSGRFAEEAFSANSGSQHTPHTLIFREDGPQALLVSVELLALQPQSILKMDN